MKSKEKLTHYSRVKQRLWYKYFGAGLINRKVLLHLTSELHFFVYKDTICQLCQEHLNIFTLYYVILPHFDPTHYIQNLPGN